MMVALLVYAYARGQRSSRGIERACVENIAFRVIAANQVPDHATIARFRQRHEDAIAELFSGGLGLCALAGMVEVGVIAIDGTKMMPSNASARRCVSSIARARRSTSRPSPSAPGSAARFSTSTLPFVPRINKTCSRSHDKKFWGMPPSS
jgi:hypothetical protein